MAGLDDQPGQGDARRAAPARAPDGGAAPRRRGAAEAADDAQGARGRAGCAGGARSVQRPVGGGPSAAAGADARHAPGSADLPGWDDDDLAAALGAYGRSAALTGMPLPPEGAGPDWFRTAFWTAPATAAFLTGYYEPELPGAVTRSDAFPVPLLALPPGFTPGPGAPDRATILTGIYDRHALCWLADPLEAFLAQVQGSVRVRLADGRVLRLGYAGKNGHPYRSIGQELVARGAVGPDRIDVQAIRDWAAAHPEALDGLLAVNPSYVFFRLLDLPPEAGPLGALGVSLTPMRSIAVDPDHVPLGSPVWIEAPGMAPRLVIAQDIGGAIKGPGRGDLYIGSGVQAGRTAGAIRATGRMWVLHPRGQG